MRYEEFKHLSVGELDTLYAYALRLTASPVDAEDLVQATYTRALSRWRQLREPAAIRAWLFQILRGIFLNEARRTAHSPILTVVHDENSEIPAIETPYPGLAERLSAVEIEDALASVPLPQREVVLLADVWGFTYPEIARIVDCPIGTVRSRLHRARLAVAEALIDIARAHGYGTDSGGAARKKRE